MDQRSATCPTCGTVVPLPRSMADDADPGGLILTCPQCREQFDYPPGIGMDKWWNEPDYKVSGTFQARGYFILRKLHQLDAAKLNTVTVGLCRDQEKDPEDITKSEWKAILEYMGASPEEIKDVQVRMGRWQ